VRLGRLPISSLLAVLSVTPGAWGSGTGQIGRPFQKDKVDRAVARAIRFLVSRQNAQTGFICDKPANRTAINALRARQRRWGFVPWTTGDLRGKDMSRNHNRSNNQRMASGMLDCARALRESGNPPLARKMIALAEEIMEVSGAAGNAYEVTRNEKYNNWEDRIRWLKGVAQRDITRRARYPRYAWYLGAVLEAYEETGEEWLLKNADHMAHLTVAVFMDDKSPLPKAGPVNTVRIQGGKGPEWPIIYSAHAGCASIMYDWLRIGVAKKSAPFLRCYRHNNGKGPCVLHLLPRFPRRLRTPKGSEHGLAARGGLTIKTLSWNAVAREVKVTLRSWTTQTVPVTAAGGIVTVRQEGAVKLAPSSVGKGVFDVTLPANATVSLRIKTAEPTRVD